MEKKPLLFVALSPLRVSGVMYAINDRVTLNEVDAAGLLKCAAVRPYTPEDEAVDAALALAAKADALAAEQAAAEAAKLAAEEADKKLADELQAAALADEAEAKRVADEAAAGAAASKAAKAASAKATGN
jgi:hypothetical protein